MDERDLIRRYLSGESAAFSELVQMYLPQVYGLALRMLKSPKEAEDITQETFIKAWKKIKNFDTERSFKPWLLTIVRNTALDFLKKKRPLDFSDLENNYSEEKENFGESIEDEEPLADQIFADKEDSKRLHQALDEIPPHYKETLLLHYKENMTFEEIGAVLKISANTVKSWHRRALIRLRKIMHQN